MVVQNRLTTMNSKQPPLQPPNTKNARYPSKTCKYAGVTFRASRDKYQARIYKGNKEYNLGLFDVSADAALAYDVAHRLVKKISAAYGKERQSLEAYEANKNAPDWFEYGEEAGANSGLDPDKLNFLRPLNFKLEREKELNDSQISGAQKHENCPKLEDLRMIVRKESIRVAKIIVGASDGGTNNYRRKGKKAALKDGSLENPKKKRKRKKASGSSASDDVKENGATTKSSKPPLQENVASAWVAKDDSFYQVTGLGRPVPNPSRTKMKEHPFGPPPVVPAGHMARNNLQMMKQMDASNLKSMMEGHPKVDELDKALHKQQQWRDNGNDKDNDKGGVGDNQASASGDDNNSSFSQDTLQAGNISSKIPGDFNNFMGGPYGGMGMGMGSSNNAMPANHNMMGVSNNNRDDFNSNQPPEHYRDFFKNMRNNMYPGMGGGGVGPMAQNNMFDASAEEFQRMMFARAMGQHPGMRNPAGIGSMMGMDPSSNLSQGDMYNDGSGDQKNNDTKRQLENLKSLSMMQGGIDRPAPTAVHQGQFGNQNLRSFSPSTLNMLRAGGYANPQGNQHQYGVAAREQLCLEAGMYGGDRFSHHLRDAYQGAQYGLNPPGFGQFGGRGEGVPSRNDQQSFLQSFGQANFPSNGNVSGGAGGGGGGGGGGGYNPAFDDMAQFLGMSASHQSKGNDEQKKC